MLRGLFVFACSIESEHAASLLLVFWPCKSLRMEYGPESRHGVRVKVHFRMLGVEPFLNVPASLIASSRCHPVDDHFPYEDFRHRPRCAVLDPILIMVRIVSVVMFPRLPPFFLGKFLPGEFAFVDAVFSRQELGPVVNDEPPEREVAHFYAGNQYEPFVPKNLE